MKIKVLKVKPEEPAEAEILKNRSLPLPGLQEAWRFNFAKLSKTTPNSSTYVLVTEETPQIIEGCLIFQMKNGIIPYGAYIVVAPHNRGDRKKYDRIAGCLIAFAFKLSLDKGKGPYRGQLFFDVQEENPEDEEKLMKNYSLRYGAVRLEDTTTMLIYDEIGHSLVEKYLRWQQDSSK
ncbi:MAG: hypothetical protein J0M30_14500 [Chitinophagales bacterium]|nr:hypothetical protein [Chitinophagales bacterium]